MLEPRAGRYQVHRRIATGGMGEVYRATMTSMAGAKKTVALKLVREELDTDDAFAQLFVQEARTIMALGHANIVQAFDVGRIDGRLFLALEFVDGVDLGAILRSRRSRGRAALSVQQALLVAIEVLKGLDYSHRSTDHTGVAQGVVHCDVSPSNILLSREGEVKVADFGVARTRQVGEREPPRGKLPSWHRNSSTVGLWTVARTYMAWGSSCLSCSLEPRR